jgi:hypothetical protein
MPSDHRDLTSGRICAALAFACLSSTPTALYAANITQCTSLHFCYCVDTGAVPVIDAKVAELRKLIDAQKSQGKAIGYISVPISSGAGSFQHINTKVAAEVKNHVEERLGATSAWALNPASVDVKLASGAEYMLMWTKILEGAKAFGEDFDFVYFVDPTDFAQHFSLDGTADMKKMDEYYDGLIKTDKELKKVDRVSFRNYYVLRASVSFSYGAHDEWNIVRAINEQRRKAAEYGIARQLAVLFDGRALPVGEFEVAVAPGNAAECKK